jgi:hypothetical protein
MITCDRECICNSCQYRPCESCITCGEDGIDNISSECESYSKMTERVSAEDWDKLKYTEVQHGRI